MKWIIIVVVVLLILAIALRRKPSEASTPVIQRQLSVAERQEITDLIVQDQKIKAIKKLRDYQPGLSLAEAKHRVEHWDLDETRRAQETRFQPAMSDELLSDVDTLIARNEQIRAIKLIRERTGMDLKSAKAVVDARSPRPPHTS